MSGSVIKRLLQRIQVYFLRQLLLRRFPERPQIRVGVLRPIDKSGWKSSGKATATGQPEAGQGYE
jgi:hypothetical protein